MAVTARQIVKKALQKAGVVTKNEDPSADEISDGVDSLNYMVESWANESLLVYARSWETFNLSSGIATYTIGSGGDFDTTRPNQIVASYVREGSVDYTLDKVSDVEYNNTISQKTISGTPSIINYDNSYPLGNVRLFPIPTGGSLFLLTEKPFIEYGLDTEVALPNGWSRALIYNLAIEVASEYGAQVDQIVYKIAMESKAAIMSSVARNRGMETPDLYSGGGFNIYRGF